MQAATNLFECLAQCPGQEEKTPLTTQFVLMISINVNVMHGKDKLGGRVTEGLMS